MTVTIARPHVRRPPVIVPDALTAGTPSTPGERGLDGQPSLDLDFISSDDSFGPRPTSSSDLPCPRTWAQQVAQALVEVLGAYRPVNQLVRWTTTDVYARLARSTSTSKPRHHARVVRPVVRRIRVDDCRDGVAEVAAVVVVGDRVRALAFRMVGRDGRWIIDQLTVG